MHESIDVSPIVYIIDDDPDVREGLSALLQSVGLRSLSFNSALEFLQSSLPDQVSCLILDVRLPDLTGLDFQAALIKTHRSISIIFISGFADIPMTVKAMKAGAMDFLTKPFRDQDLLDSVHAALDRDRKQRKESRKTNDLRLRFESLSTREREVMRLITRGLMNKQSAAELGVTEVTVKVHRHNVMSKLGARSLAELVRMAARLELTEVPSPRPNKA
jgi:FixJ family two-component response regulator